MLNSSRLPRAGLLALYKSAFIPATVIIVALCVSFEPFWETNDDVAMSMIAHGHGIAAYSSPHLIFSNVLWGYLASALPPVNGVVGYSWLTLTMLFIAVWSMLYFLGRLETNRFLAFGAVLLIAARAVCFPQFTIVAGLLTVSAVMGWITYAKTSSLHILLAATLLGFAGFLIRDQEFFFVMLVALPLLPWRILIKDKRFMVSVAVLICCALAATLVDRQSYKSESWQAFQKFNPVRVQFTDYGAGDFIKSRFDLKDHFKYSNNDLDLLANWFFVDTTITDPDKLGEMLKERNLSTRLSENNNFRSGLQGGKHALTSLADPYILPLEIALLGLLFLTSRRWQMAGATGIFLLAIIAVGLLGRPGIFSVYYPAIALLVVSPLLLGNAKRPAVITRAAAFVILAFACITAFKHIVPENRFASAYNKLVQKDVAKLKANENNFPYYVAWAQFFPYEYAYPLLHPPPALHFYALNSFTNAPFSVSFSENEAGRGLARQLLSGQPVPIIATDKLYDMLAIWCRERFKNDLQKRLIEGMTFKMFLVTCGNT